MNTNARVKWRGHIDTVAHSLVATALVNVVFLPIAFFSIGLIFGPLGGEYGAFLLAVAPACLLYVWTGRWLHLHIMSVRRPWIPRWRCVAISVACGFAWPLAMLAVSASWGD